MHQKSILIADDDEAVLSLSTFSVEAMGFTALKARNGREAIEIATETPPDLFILDWIMPEVDGIEVTEFLRQSEKLKNIPIIMITGTNVTPQLIAQAMEKGINDFLAKPFNKIELEARIKSLIKQASYFKEIIDLKNNEIYNTAMLLAHSLEEKKITYAKLETIKEMKSSKTQQKMIGELISQLKVADKINPFDKIKKQFIKVHSKFMDNLIEAHPNLTPAEIKLCILLRLNLNTKEIAALLFHSYDSVRVSRTRLREKLGLDVSDKLNVYLMRY